MAYWVRGFNVGIVIEPNQGVFEFFPENGTYPLILNSYVKQLHDRIRTAFFISRILFFPSESGDEVSGNLWEEEHRSS